MEIKTIILFAALPSLSIIFLTWLIRFPKPWVFKAVLIFEIILTVCTLVIELDARKAPGNSGWIIIFTGFFQFCFLLFLLIARIRIWIANKS